MWGRSPKSFAFAQRLAKEVRARVGRSFSEGGPSRTVGDAKSSKPSGTAEEAPGSRLFENVQQEAEARSAAPTEAGPKSAATGSWLSRIGNTVFFSMLGATAFFGYYTYRYTNDQIEIMVEETKKDENSFPGSSLWIEVMNWYSSQRSRMESEVKKYSDPTSDQLLPDLHPQIRHVQTLVLDLDDLLIHSDWTRGRGWRTFKRPGASELIKHMAPYFEMVIYTSQLPTYADPILDRLDPQHLIQYRLYRDSTQYRNGRHMRDLSKLNRDLSKVLLVTADPETASMQQGNAVVIRKWKMESEDTALLDLIPFLEAVSTARHVDVREVIESYEGQDIPTAFRQRIKEAAEKQRQQRGKRSFLGGLGSR